MSDVLLFLQQDDLFDCFFSLCPQTFSLSSPEFGKNESKSPVASGLLDPAHPVLISSGVETKDSTFLPWLQDLSVSFCRLNILQSQLLRGYFMLFTNWLALICFQNLQNSNLVRWLMKLHLHCSGRCNKPTHLGESGSEDEAFRAFTVVQTERKCSPSKN